MRAPGTSVSPMTAAFSAADQRRRRTDPVETAPRLSSPCALSSPSNITITRSSLLLQAKQTLRLLPLKKGARAPLTEHPAHKRRATVTRLALPADDLHPAERLLDPFAHAQAHLVTGVLRPSIAERRPLSFWVTSAGARRSRMSATKSAVS